MIKEETKRLQTLIENILTTSITERDGFKINKSELNLSNLLMDITDRAKFLVEQKNGTLFLDLPQEPIIILGDKLHLGNALFNIIDNSLKYCEQTPQIKITASVTKAQVIIIFSDNGIGINNENLEKIFDSMYRVPTGNVHNVKGFGLGLSYCKNILLKHGGNISVKSQINQGSEFTIQLPLLTQQIQSHEQGKN